jgi:hypothetical protein
VEFSLAWEQVADAFAKHASDPRGQELSKTGKLLWGLTEYAIHGAELLNESGKQMGVTLIPDFGESRAAQLLILGVKGVASFGRPAMEYIRRGRADEKRGKIKRALLDAATARVGRVT